MVNLKLHLYDQVISDATKALDIDQDYLKAYHRRGKAYQAKGDLQRALHDFEQCIAREPNDPQILASLGEVCELIE